jgi:hypothetical protein
MNSSIHEPCVGKRSWIHDCVCGFELVQGIKLNFVSSVVPQVAGFEFGQLTGLSLTPDGTRLLVCDSYNSRVVVANALDGQYIRTLKGPPGVLQCPTQAIVVPLTGQVLVVDFYMGLVVVFAGVYNDTVVRLLGLALTPRVTIRPQGVLRNPHSLTLLDGDLADAAIPNGPVAVVADTGNNRLTLFEVNYRTAEWHIGAQAQLDSPMAVTVVPACVTGTGEAWLVVADYRIQLLTRTGMVVRVLQEDGGSPLFGAFVSMTFCMRTWELLATDNTRECVLSVRLPNDGCRVVCQKDDDLKFEAPVTKFGPNYLRGIVTMDNGAWMSDSGLLYLLK